MQLEVVTQLLHLSHVSRQDGLDHALTNSLVLGRREHVGEEVVVVDVEKLHSLRSVEVLLHVLVAVHLVDG